MRWRIKNLLSYSNGVSDNYDFGNVFFGWDLVNVASDSEQLGFRTSDKSSVMKNFGEKMIWYMHMQNRCSNIILDASIYCNNGYGLQKRWLNGYWVELLEAEFIIFSFIKKIERKLIWKGINDSETQRKFWMKRRERRKHPIRSVVRINKMAFDACSLSISEGVKRRGMSVMKRTKWRIHKHLNNMISWEGHCIKLQSAPKFL